MESSSSPSPATTGPTLPAGQTQTSFNSVFVQVDQCVFNPTLVMAFLHRPGSEGTTPVTEVFYESHHISVEDPKQALFYYLCGQTRPQPISAAL
jgi:hypothetical protein